MTLRDGLISLNNVMARSLDEIEEHYFNVEGVANLKQVTFSFGGPTHGLWLVGNNDRARVLTLRRD